MSPQSAAPPAAPFGLESIHFNFARGRGIELRNPETDLAVGAAPEWDVAGRREVAAYLRGALPELRVVFRGTPAAVGTFTVGADGSPFQVEERTVNLAFDPVNGRSAPEVFRARTPLPNQIGVHPTKLDWYLRTGPPPAICPPIGTSTHRICTAWRAMTADTGQGLRAWAYKPLMEWTCAWAAGQDDQKDICDAILRNARLSGLCYGMPPRVTENVRELLQAGGGMCADWCMVFQQMAHCQGVFVHRRAFAVDWRAADDGQVRWCALVIRDPGLNQDVPTHSESDFDDNDTGYPIGAPVPIVRRREGRYQFFGNPTEVEDGHCVNFLEHTGKLFLYDVCFRREPVEIDAPLPVPDSTVARGGAELAPFKEAYVDGAVDYMLGSLYNGSDFHECRVRDHGVFGGNGMTVRTGDIPEIVDGEAGLTFFWLEV